MRRLAVLLLLAAGLAHAQDPAARALLLRQQQSDDFALQLQQSLQSHRAGPMTPQQRLDFDALQRGQRMQQNELNYRQQIQQAEPRAGDSALRRAEILRFEQDRQNQLSRFRWEGEQPAPVATPTHPLVEPGVATAPVPRQIRIPEGDPGGWVEW
ncbi:MAG: hypothetical protein ACM36B_19805, partial [Bacteroidota bacterium]